MKLVCFYVFLLLFLLGMFDCEVGLLFLFLCLFRLLKEEDMKLWVLCIKNFNAMNAEEID